MIKNTFSNIPPFITRNDKQSIWGRLIGNPEEFSLERRVFHSVSIGLIAIALIYAPYNYVAGLFVGSVTAVIIGLFFFQQYYYSRFKNKPHSNTLFGIIGLLAFGINYFAIAGMKGSTDVIWPAYLLVLLVISPYRQHVLWLVVYLSWFLAIHMLGYYYPQYIEYPFTTLEGQFIDRITAFPLPVFVIYIIVRFIRRNYDLERLNAQKKTTAIEISKEKILRQKEELEQRSLEKDNLMSIISHDVRAPLVNIQSYLMLLNKNILSAEERYSIEKNLESATSQTINMLSNLLNWSKTQMGGAVVHLETVNLLQALDSTIEMGRSYALKKSIKFVNTMPADLMVVVDVDMLQIIIRNLINNALKFTEVGGAVTIHAFISKQNCEITIKDNGRGIAPNDQESIFSNKAAPTYGTNNEKGVGLGLALCKEFTKRMGGKIGFESTVNAGSKFFILVPLAEEMLLDVNNQIDDRRR